MLSWHKNKKLGHRKRIITVYKSCHQRCSFKKCVLKCFTIFTGKQLCWSLFLIKCLCLSEADQSLFKKEAAEFLQSEEISFELLHDLHYITKFYVETHRLFHPQILPTLRWLVSAKNLSLNAKNLS